jgi:hypothetical protein
MYGGLMKMQGQQFSKQRRALVLVAALLLVVGCAPAGDTSLNSDGRILMQDRLMTIELPENSSMAAPVSLSLTLAFDVLPPVASNTGNIQTYASDIVISGNYAYTAYNTVGTPQAGAIDVLNLGILGIVLPYIESSKYFTDFDVNTVAVESGVVWALGAKENVSAHLKKIPLSGMNMQTPSLQVDLPSYAGTGLAPGGGVVFATTGDNGGMRIINSTTGAVTATVNMNDARDVEILGNGDRLVLAGGSCRDTSVAGVSCITTAGTRAPPKIERYSSAGVLVWSTTLVGASIPESKSTLAVGSTYAAAALGDGGLSLICLADGKVMTTIPQVTVSGLASTLTVTNAVAAAPGMLMTADGQGGVSMYQIESSTTGPTSACAKVKLTSAGRSTFGDGSSANNISPGTFGLTIGLFGVKIYLGRMYVAAGSKGIRAVELNFTLTAGTTVLNL